MVWLKHQGMMRRTAVVTADAMGRFRKGLVREAHRRGFDGVVCGHIHHAEIRLGGVLYLNCGDWLESCTSLVEHHDGSLELIDWAAEHHFRSTVEHGKVLT